MAIQHLRITPGTVNTIALLNGGVRPEVENEETYFVFDDTWNSDVPAEILSIRDLDAKYGSVTFMTHTFYGELVY